MNVKSLLTHVSTVCKVAMNTAHNHFRSHDQMRLHGNQGLSHPILRANATCKHLEELMIVTGLFLKQDSNTGRDIQSRVFFKTPGSHGVFGSGKDDSIADLNFAL